MKILTKPQLVKLLKSIQGKSYTYGLVDDNYNLFYVGVGTKNRVLAHATKSNLRTDNNKLKVSKILKQKEVKYCIFLVHVDRKECLSLENKLITKFGRRDICTGNLCNLTDGGEIGPVGFIASTSTKNKLSLIRKEQASALSDANKEYWANLPSEKKTEIVSNMREGITEDTHKKTGQKSKERWQDAAYRERLSIKQKESQSLIADIHSENMRKKWADPIYREQMLEKRKIAKLKKLATDNQFNQSN
jgi:hypothetical protein